MGVIQLVSSLLRALLANRAALAMENLALRQQPTVLERSVKRLALRQRDRIFWAWLSRLWNGWRAALLIVRPETVIKWHRQGFRLYWRWKSRCRKPGRPKIKREVRDLIRRMSRENPIWGVPRIQAELNLLGHDVADGSVAKYMVRARKPFREDSLRQVGKNGPFVPIGGPIAAVNWRKGDAAQQQKIKNPQVATPMEFLVRHNPPRPRPRQAREGQADNLAHAVQLQTSA